MPNSEPSLSVIKYSLVASNWCFVSNGNFSCGSQIIIVGRHFLTSSIHLFIVGFTLFAHILDILFEKTYKAYFKICNIPLEDTSRSPRACDRTDFLGRSGFCLRTKRSGRIDKVLTSYPSSNYWYYKSDNHHYEKKIEYPRHTGAHCFKPPIQKNHNRHNTGYGGHNSSHSVIFPLFRLNLFLIDRSGLSGTYNQA